MSEITSILAKELIIAEKRIDAALKLLDEGNTIPFIARYRKEVTGELDEEQIRNISERAQYLRNLAERRSEIILSITAQEKMTPELEKAINSTTKLQDLEDLYLPYRPKKRTRAQIAREKGLAPLADLIIAQEKPAETLEQLAAAYLNEEQGLLNIDDVWAGASDIVAETVAERADIRELVRQSIRQNAELVSELCVDETVGQDFLMYKEYAEPVKQLPPHRILELNRGEKKGCLKLHLNLPSESTLAKINQKLQIKANGIFTETYTAAAADAYKRLIFPSLEREIRNELTEKAEKQAIAVFATNLRQLLLQRPLSGHTVLGLDPGYRTGCKAAVISPEGQVKAIGTLYMTGSDRQHAQAEEDFLNLVKNNNVTLVSIGNGTASFETEEFTAQMIEKHALKLS